MVAANTKRKEANLVQTTCILITVRKNMLIFMFLAFVSSGAAQKQKVNLSCKTSASETLVQFVWTAESHLVGKKISSSSPHPHTSR